MALKHYLAEVFAAPLALSIVSALLGVAAASHYSAIGVVAAVLVVVGVACAHMSTNLIDDYIDFSSGVDSETIKTTFNGGSESLETGDVAPARVLLIGVSALAIAASIGAYLLATHPSSVLFVLPIVIIGGLTALTYAKYVLHIPFAAEPTVALNFALISAGAFLLLNGTHHIFDALFAFVPAGILVGLVLVINEVPDRPSDTKHGRKSTVVLLKSEKRIAVLYLALQAVAYAIVIAGVLLHAMPAYAIGVLVTVPFVAFVTLGTLRYSGVRAYTAAMAANVIATLLFMAVLIIGYTL